MRKYALRAAVALLVVLVFCGHVTRHLELPFVQRIESMLYDARLRLTMPGTIDDRIVIVDIDEKSLASEGRWPWPRDRIGLLLDRLFDDYAAQLVGFDVVFAEPDRSSGLKQLERLARNELAHVDGFRSALEALAPGLQYDRILAQKMAGRPVVLGYYFTHEGARGPAHANALPPPVLPPGALEGVRTQPTVWTGYGANLPELQEAAAAVGHFNPWPDEDGITRRVPMLAEFAGAYYESLALAVLRVLMHVRSIAPGLGEAVGRARSLEWLDVGGDIRIPVDGQATALVPYRGPAGSFPYVSAADVLSGKADRAVLADRVVLVGATAPGLNDLRATPVGPVYPGVEVHANLIAGALDGRIPHMPGYVVGLELLVLAASGVLLALVLPLLAPLPSTLLTLGVFAGAGALNLVLWQRASVVLPLAATLLMIGALFALNMSYGFFVEARARRQITRRFGQYVPPPVVEVMSRHPERFSMQGESRELTVLFSDVRGFTTVSEGLDPKVLAQVMNEFLTALTRVIHTHRGTIDKYMGDCIMAFWGAPVADTGHARNAVLAGLDLLSAMQALQPRFAARGWPVLDVGVGINTGRMTVGNMGSEIRVAYTVMGDSVNFASRLEALTRHYGVGMLVGASTRAACAAIAFREVDRVRARGKREAVAVFEPLAPAHALDAALAAEVEHWHAALGLYRQQRWSEARAALSDLQRLRPQSILYAEFLRRVEVLRAQPPGADWDGAWTFDSK
ncbi:MAG: adenylate/guanylate cyclase domain-containing protein [Burkholderiales bacterium]|nr:adenylate/guanylate cyclase domain-containing protein [Burkholderiales bacterium]